MHRHRAIPAGRGQRTNRGIALGAAAPLFSNQEIEVEKTLSLGDASFEKSDYPAAIELYFKAAALSTKPGNLSRAHRPHRPAPYHPPRTFAS